MLKVRADDVASFAEAALARMQALGVPPTPENYTIWFAYFSGGSPELARTLDVLVSNRQDFTEELTNQIYARFFLGAREGSVAREVSQRVESTMAQLQTLLSSAGDGAGRYGAALDSFSSGLRTAETLQRVRELVEGIVHETRQMATQNRRLETELDTAAKEIAEMRRHLEDVRREAMTDALTGVSNRKSFEIELRKAAMQAVEEGQALSLLMLDVDHFKNFNDTYGHQMGDQVLKLVARVLRESVKGRDTTARYGGEEFVILLPQTPLDAAKIVGEQIRKTVARSQIVKRASGESLTSITLSVGATCYEPGETLADFVQRADMALYQAKRLGRNRVVATLPRSAEAKAASSSQTV